MSASRRDSVYRIDSRDCIVAVDAWWLKFARDNGAPELTRERVLGRPLRRFVQGDVVYNLWEILIRRVRGSEDSLLVPFRCDSPGERRFMESRLSALPDGEVEFSCRLVRSETREAVSLLDRGVARSEAWLTMCAWCNRLSPGEDRWLEAEEAVRQLDLLDGAELPRLTGGVCSPCRDRIIAGEG